MTIADGPGCIFRLRRSLVVALVAGLFASSVAAQERIRVGSKSFTENFIVGEILAQIAEDSGEASVVRNMGLGSAAIAYAALRAGEIDVYPEYSGTIGLALLNDPAATEVDVLRERLRPLGLTVSDPIGFNNTYAIAMTETRAAELGISRISDLAAHPQLSAAFSAGYLDRPDGWPGLQQTYGLDLSDLRIIEHALKYEAVAQGEVDLIDIYTTDAKLQRYDLRLLEDDRNFFADYHAVLFARVDFVDRFPQTWDALNDKLVGAIDDELMSAMNARADLDRISTQEIAAAFLERPPPQDALERRIWRDVARHTVDHLFLVFVSVGLAILVGIPTGVVAARFRTLGRAALLSVEVIQTIPSLALLVFMIPLFGIGQSPALVALFLYALLPIVRNTYAGLIGVDRQLVEIAGVLGLDSMQTLRRIELPLASLAIMTGIKTSAVITVGTATLAAFIGGGGYGTLIVRGLALNDNELILAGALPAAVMAILIHLLFERVDRVVVPRGLRIGMSEAT